MALQVEEKFISIGPHLLTQPSLSKIISKAIECILFDLQQISCLPVPVQDDIFPKMSVKMKNCFDAIQSLQTGLETVDLSKVHAIALILGGSPTVPRAIFEISYRHDLIYNSETCSSEQSENKENINDGAAIQRFFHHFIQCDLCGSDTLPPTKMFVYFKASRFLSQDWLVPKLTYCMSKRAKIHKRIVIVNELNANETTEFEVPPSPGTERTSTKTEEKTLDSGSRRLSAPTKTTDEGSSPETPMSEFNDDSDLIWYAAPIVIPGYPS